VKGFSAESKLCIQYPNLPCAIWPVPHDGFPIPKTPSAWTIDDEGEESFSDHRHGMLYRGARGGSLATSYTPHLTMCMHSCMFGLLTILETEGFCNPSIFCVLSVRRRWQGCGKIYSRLSIIKQAA